MSDQLKTKTFHGVFWSFLQNVGPQAIQFFVSIILARVLVPEEFGLIAMIMVFVGVSRTFVDSGFGLALVQKKNATHLDECSVFYFNIFLGFLMAGCMFFAAPWIAAFYERPVLILLTRVMSLNLIIASFGIVPTVILTKSMDFKTQMIVSLIAIVFSGTIGVTMGCRGFGVWSLVAQSISSRFFRTVLLWFFHDWRPTWIFSFRALRTMFSFGSKLLFSGLLNVMFNNIYSIVIGKLFSAVDLGIYARARTLQKRPITLFAGTLGRVAFPAFSSIQDDRVRMTCALRKMLTMSTMVNFPIMIGLAVVAKPLVVVILTDKWLPSVLFLQLLCVAGLLYPLQLINLAALKALGRSDLFLRLEIIKKILTVAGVLITYRWGISAMIYGEIAVSCMSYYLNSYYIGKLLNYSIASQLYDVISYFILAVLMGLSIFSLHYVSFLNQPALLIAQIMIGAMLYIFLCWLFRLKSFMEAVELVKTNLIARRRLN